MFASFRKKVNILIMKHVEECSKKYTLRGFWLKGKNTGESEESNPYIYFPSEERAREEYTKALKEVPEDSYKKQLVKRTDYYEDGDKVYIAEPREYTISYKVDDIIGLSYEDHETIQEVADRIWSSIVLTKARENYIKTLAGANDPQ